MNPSGLRVNREGSRIRIAGKLDQYSFRRLLASMHQATAVKGFQDLTLDFSDTTQAYPGAMLAVLATCARLRDESDVDFALVRPQDGPLRRLFVNTNWAHLANPLRFAESSWRPESVLPASRFASPDEQHRIVDQIMDAVLSSPAALTRESLAAFHSGFASLRPDLRARQQKSPFRGTLVVVRLDYSDPEALWRALDIQGARLGPAGDYLELRYEHPSDDALHFMVKREAGSLGSRSAGNSARLKLENLMKMYPDFPVNLDFADVGLVSSSFADEFLGKLFVRVGALGFSRRIRFHGVTPTVQSLLDKAILQRVQQEGQGD